MVLSTHAVIGGATALFLKQNPLFAFFAASASHFILDAIPHWHYPLASLRHPSKDPMDDFFIFDRFFLKDVLKTAMDFGIGLIVTLVGVAHAPENIPIALVGAAGGVVPDALQLAYYLFPWSPLRHLQKFHHTIHAKTRLDDQPLLGISSQVLLIGIFFAVLQALA